MLNPKVFDVVQAIGTPGFFRAISTLPKFSVASFLINHKLKMAGITPDRTFDVGANVGQFALTHCFFFSEVSVVSYEPVAKAYEELVQNTLNYRIECKKLAIAAQSGESEILVNAHSHSSSMLELGKEHLRGFPEATVVGSEMVEVRTIDEEAMLNPIGDDSCLLKIDVQGLEREVILGAEQTLSEIDYLLLEMSFKPMYQGEPAFSELNSLLESLGFRLVEPVGFLHSTTDGRVVQMDVLYCK